LQTYRPLRRRRCRVLCHRRASDPPPVNAVESVHRPRPATIAAEADAAAEAAAEAAVVARLPHPLPLPAEDCDPTGLHQLLRWSARCLTLPPRRRWRRRRCTSFQHSEGQL
jgi:hypothetical protein